MRRRAEKRRKEKHAKETEIKFKYEKGVLYYLGRGKGFLYIYIFSSCIFILVAVPLSLSQAAISSGWDYIAGLPLLDYATVGHPLLVNATAACLI